MYSHAQHQANCLIAAPQRQQTHATHAEAVQQQQADHRSVARVLSSAGSTTTQHDDGTLHAQKQEQQPEAGMQQQKQQKPESGQQPQVQQLHHQQQQQGLAVDFVLRMEHIDEDWPALVQEINRRRDPSLPAIDVGSYTRWQPGPDKLVPRAALREMYGGVGSADMPGTLEEAYGGSNAGCREAVMRHFAGDIELLGYGYR